METENTFTKISQSLTGNLIAASVVGKGDVYETFIFEEN